MTLEQFFRDNPKVALGFSGGVDSSYLLYMAKICNVDIKAYFIKTLFQPEFELKDAKKLAEHLGVEITVIEHDVLSNPEVVANSDIRCYHCKTNLFGLLKERALADGYHCLIDGTNASDDPTGRPGMKALTELKVHSPLRECGLTKPEIRRLSRAAGLFTSDKPAYACLATRIPTGTPITKEGLNKVEKCEDILMGFGFSDFRVRLRGEAAYIQLPKEQMSEAIRQREKILEGFKDYFKDILLDLKAR